MNMKLDDPLNIVIAGVGGQGNVLCARLLGRTLMKKDYFVSIVDSFGSTQRGGSVRQKVSKQSSPKVSLMSLSA